MVDENHDESAATTGLELTPDEPGPFAPGAFTPGKETRVAMDLAGIQGVERRHTILMVIAIGLAAIAAIALVYALV